MTKFASNKGIALLTVLVVLLVVVALAVGILNITLNQSRLTHHKVSRIQAYYATTAGVNFALDKLRRGNDPNWPKPTAGIPVVWHCMSQNGVVPQCVGDLAPIIEPRLPGAIQYVIVRVAIRGAPAGNPAVGAPWPLCNPPQNPPQVNDICVNAQAIYTYQ